MLETLVRAALVNAHNDSVVVSSAGTGASNDDHASVGAQRAMQRRGLNLSQHASRNVRSLDLSTFDQFWCMTPNHAAALLSLGVPASAINVVNEVGGGVPDPWGPFFSRQITCQRRVPLFRMPVLTKPVC